MKKTIDLAKIQFELNRQARWKKETRDQLKQECAKLIGAAEWHWERFDMKGLEYWMRMYDFILRVKHTEHEQFTADKIVRDYTEDFEAYASRYFGIKVNGKSEEGFAVRL